jgi:hypothetical protein
MKNYLSQFIERSEQFDNSQLKILPLIHTTDAYNFREIIDNGFELKPKHCDVFNESLLYLFYGKASYVKSQPFNSFLGPYFPVTFVIDPNSINEVTRIFPFDSGAFSKKIFENYIPEKLKINSFLLEEESLDLKSASKIVKAFYKSNENYFQNIPRNDIDINSLNFEVEALVNMMRSKENTPFDERSSTIEIQVNQELKLIENTLAIILPSVFLDDPKIQELIKKMKNTEFITYSTLRGNPTYFASVIIDRIGHFLNRKVFLSLDNA